MYNFSLFFSPGDDNFWTSARYHANASVWKWSPSNETFDDAANLGERGDCMAYHAGLKVFAQEGMSCNSTAYVLCGEVSTSFFFFFFLFCILSKTIGLILFDRIQ